MEPMASVIHAARKASHSLLPPLGQNSNLPASEAAAITLPAPPAMSPTSQATRLRPTRITTDWKRSVSATDHIPPQIVYTTTIAAPIAIPALRLIAPPESTETTSPSAG